MTRLAYIAGVANAQRVARDAVLSVAAQVRAGDSELAVCARLEREFEKANVRHWLHTPYAWWGERTRFDWGGGSARAWWEPSALPSERVLREGEAFVLDAAPIVAGFPADFAYSGLCGPAPSGGAHARLLDTLSQIKRELPRWASGGSSASVCAQVESHIRTQDLDVIHTRYPAQVLAHTLEGFPNFISGAPRVGTGFQLPLLVTYGLGIVLHHLTGAAYPFLNATAPGVPRGLYAVEPHLGSGALGAKFESVLLVDGDETRWLDPELFGEVVG